MSAKVNKGSIKHIECTPSQLWLLAQRGIFALIAGYGAAKTWGILLKLDYDAREWKLKDGRNSSYIVAEPVFSMIEDVIYPKIEEFCELYGYDWENVPGKQPRVIIHAYGYSFLLYLRSCENYTRWEGMQGTVDYPLRGGCIDEASTIPYPRAWEYMCRRVSRFAPHDAIRFMTTTPPVPIDGVGSKRKHNINWIYDAVQNIHEASTLENRFLPDIAGYADEIRSQVGDVLAKSLVEGKRFDSIQGKLIWAFKPELHLVRADPASLKSFWDYKDQMLSWDFNLDPMICVRAVVIRGVVFIYHVYVHRKMATRVVARKIAQEYSINQTVALYGDPSGSRLTTNAETDKMGNSLSDYDQIRDEFARARIETKLEVESRAPSIHGSADSFNIALERGMLKIVFPDDKNNLKYLVHDMEVASLDPEDYKTWKENYPNDSHALDAARYMNYSLFGDTRIFKARERSLMYSNRRL